VFAAIIGAGKGIEVARSGGLPLIRIEEQLRYGFFHRESKKAVETVS
jgi:hypothetical protein